jgi:hypothetical protein
MFDTEHDRNMEINFRIRRSSYILPLRREALKQSFSPLVENILVSLGRASNPSFLHLDPLISG